MLAYLSYLCGDWLGLSGIVALFCCAVTISHYALHNVSSLSRVTTVSAFQTLSYVSEGAIFIYVGMDTLDPLKWQVQALPPTLLWRTTPLLALVLQPCVPLYYSLPCPCTTALRALVLQPCLPLYSHGRTNLQRKEPCMRSSRQRCPFPLLLLPAAFQGLLLPVAFTNFFAAVSFIGLLPSVGRSCCIHAFLS